MIPVTVARLTELLDARGRETDHLADVDVTGVATDSRLVTPGDVYVARIGEHADGADFAGEAVAAGAVVVVAQRPLEVPTVVVADADVALVRIAADVRDRSEATVVAITGSVGKTTTKDLVAAALGPSRRVVAARGSFNNEVGVPLTVARLQPDTEALVTELGARGVGQVAALSAWVRPDVAIVTAVAPVHLELFGTIAAVATAKAELVEALQPSGLAILNIDDARVAAMSDRTGARILSVSALGATDADVRARDVTLDDVGRARFLADTPWGTHDVVLPVAGAHHVGNALLALATAGGTGADVAAAVVGVAQATVSQGRSTVIRVGGATVLDDSYNANPTSVIAALETLRAMAARGRRVAVLGVMGEIGADHEREHRRVGIRAAEVLDRLVVVGEEAGAIADGARAAGLQEVVVVARDDAPAAVAAGDGDIVLVKASRVAGLEHVVAALGEGVRV